MKILCRISMLIAVGFLMLADLGAIVGPAEAKGKEQQSRGKY